MEVGKPVRKDETHLKTQGHHRGSWYEGQVVKLREEFEWV